MISVCIATYNGEKYIKKQLDSILKQLSGEDEVIISDDASTDKTLDIIRAFNDERIKIFKHESDHGFVKNFENALKYANGDYIFLADQDDEWADDKVEKIIDVFKNENADFVVSDCITIDEKNRILDNSRFKTFNIKKGFFRIMIKSRFLGCCMAFNKKVLNAVLPFPENVNLVEHDTWIATVAMKYFNVVLIEKPLVYYKRHGENCSDGGFSEGYSLANKILRRLYRYNEILKINKKVRRSNK